MIRRCDCDAGRAFSYTERFRWEYKLGVVLRRGKPKNLFGSGVGICRTSHGTRFKLAEMIERPTRHSRCHNPPRHFSSNFLVCRCVARNFSRVLNLSTSRCHASFALYSVIMGARDWGFEQVAKSLGSMTVQTELANLQSVSLLRPRGSPLQTIYVNGNRICPAEFEKP